MSASRAELVALEIERLKGEAKILQRDWRRIPFLAAFIVLAAPAFFVWGPAAAMYTVLAVPCLIGTAAYLVGVRIRENRELLRELQDQVRDEA
ncbi:MAG: hypothetical protein AB7S26_31725 [Sandaracinaceae bacterium]